MMTTTRTAPAPGFTPGPWFEHSHRQIGPKGGVVAEIWSAVGTSSDDAIAQADANVHLIAAAPELYDALRAALVVVSGLNADGYFNQAEREIRAALALAEGRSAMVHLEAAMERGMRAWGKPDFRQVPTSPSLATISSDSEGGEA